MARMLRVPGVAAILAQSLRLAVNRRSPLAYGALSEGRIDDEILRAWTEPQIRDKACGATAPVS